MSEKGSNQQHLRKKNSQLIQKYIYQHSPVSRVEIAQALGLTTATITGMVTPLLAQGLLQETAEVLEEGKTAGRPRMMLEFNPDAYCLCGVDMGPYWINYILTDLQGKVLAFRHTRETLEDFQTTLDLLSEQIPRFLKENGMPREKVLGVGVCMPGLIDGSQDKIYTTFREGWTERNFPIELEKRLGIRVEVENNVRARAIGSELFDRSVSESILAYFFVSYGVACQLIIEGKVLYGQFAAAGEIGHTVVARGGPVCPTCGNRGCLEALAGERAVLEHCRKLWASGQPTALRQMCQNPEELKMEHVLNAQTMGDQAVNLIMEDVLEYLGIALANTINMVSPGTVMLDGHIFDIPRNRTLLLQAVERNMFRVHVNHTRFAFLPYDPARGARGAAAVVMREFLLNDEYLNVGRTAEKETE